MTNGHFRLQGDHILAFILIIGVGESSVFLRKDNGLDFKFVFFIFFLIFFTYITSLNLPTLFYCSFKESRVLFSSRSLFAVHGSWLFIGTDSWAALTWDNTMGYQKSHKMSAIILTVDVLITNSRMLPC